MKNKIIDCITFFDDNFMFNLRYNILKDYVDHFFVCESRYNHKGLEKKINFIMKNEYDQSKITHIIKEEKFPKNSTRWQNQAIQREYLLTKMDNLDPEDYVLFSDPDEIPKPELLMGFELKKKYGIFLQKCFVFKFNLFNKYESPWEGTRVCKKKNLKSIDFMRHKVRSKNLKYSFLRIDKEKSIKTFENGGWHFNNLLTPTEISIKLKTFAHSEFSKDKFSSIKIIEEKINKKVDLFERGHQYKTVILDDSFPKYILKNIHKLNQFIISDSS